MFKWMLLCACLVVAGCQQERPATNGTAGSAKPSQPSKAQGGSVKWSEAVTSTQPSRSTAAAGMAIVEVHVQGLCAIVDQQDAALPKDSKSIVIPNVSANYVGHIAAHTAFLAWRMGSEGTPPAGVIDVADPIDSSSWRVHLLAREEIVLPDLKTSNPAVTAPLTGKCGPIFGKALATATLDCFPPLGKYLHPSKPLDPDHIARVKPSADIAGRMELSYGALSAIAGDRCEWAIFPDGSGTPDVTYLANDLVYTFEYPAKSTLTLRTRKLDDDLSPNHLTDLMTITTPDAGKTIQLRLGNMMIVNNTLPRVLELEGSDDAHIAAYYKFFSDPGSTPIPHRTTHCNKKMGPYNPDVYCGPGRVKS